MVVANSTVNKNAKDVKGMNALHYAAIYGNLEIFKFLHKYGWFYYASKVTKATPLHLAWKYQHVDIVRFIIGTIGDAYIDTKRDNGLTPLMIAWINGNYELVELLLEKGADPLIKSPHNTSALYYSAKQGNLEILKLICKNSSVDINEKFGPSESTALQIACLNSNFNTMKYLMLKGADIKIRNKNDEDVLDSAALSDSNRVFIRIAPKFVTFNAGKQSEEWDRVFNYENKVCGLTLLTRLVLLGKFKVAKMLFNSGIDVNYQHSSDGSTVLHKAMEAHNK